MSSYIVSIRRLDPLESPIFQDVEIFKALVVADPDLTRRVEIQEELNERIAHITDLVLGIRTMDMAETETETEEVPETETEEVPKEVPKEVPETIYKEEKLPFTIFDTTRL